MPGINKWRTLDLMNRSIASRKITVRTVQERAKKVIELAKRVAQESPEVSSPTLVIYSVYQRPPRSWTAMALNEL